VLETHSISAGLDYPGVGPEHAWLKESGRARYLAIGDAEAVAALEDCCRFEGILPALESAHALAGAKRLAAEHPGSRLLVCCSGRGDKDLGILAGLGGGQA
jgi:tryptophan synthase beta chain